MRSEEQKAYRFPHDSVDEASEESFPASDPPSFMPGVGDLPEDRHPVQPSGTKHRVVVDNSEMSFRQDPDALQCCGERQLRTWGMLVASTAAGMMVGCLLANRYLARH